MDGIFLAEWLTAADESMRLFEEQRFSRDALNEQAICHGYRTGAIWVEAMNDRQAALQCFINSKAFADLWGILKAHDEIYGEDHAYSALICGVPNQLLKAIDAWHRVPKFTTAERMRHSRKVAQACEKLQDLLGQVLPGETFESQYSRFMFARDGQADAVFRAFKSELINVRGAVFEAGHRLKACGVTPLWAVKNIRTMAESESRRNISPTKLRATTAKKTYLIKAVSDVIDRACIAEYPKNLGLTHRHIADVVGLLAGMDCEIDDVRKRLSLVED